MRYAQGGGLTAERRRLRRVWSLLRRGLLANTAFAYDEHLECTRRRGLRHIQLRPGLIDACLACTRLTLTQLPRTTRGSQ